MSKDWGVGEPIVDGLINTGDIIFLYGQVGHGKTLEGAELAISVAADRPAFGAFPCSQGTVLVVQEDLHPQTFQRYVRILVDAYQIDLDIPLYIWERQFLRLDDPAQAEAFIQKVLEIRPKLIIIDAFLDLHSGDGFTGGELRPILDCIGSLPQRLPCAVVVLDHPKKEGPGIKQNADPVDMLYGGRPKSAIADTMIMTKRTGESPPRFTLSTVKPRTEPRAPFSVTFTAERGFALDDTPIGLTPSAIKLLHWAQSNPPGSTWTKKQAVEGAGVAPRSLDSAINELRFNRLVVDGGRIGRAKAYQLRTAVESDESGAGA